MTYYLCDLEQVTEPLHVVRVVQWDEKLRP